MTQKEDGGWWEGTSRETGKTGWFPSNYVSDMKESTPTSETVLKNILFTAGNLVIFALEKFRIEYIIK